MVEAAPSICHVEEGLYLQGLPSHHYYERASSPYHSFQMKGSPGKMRMWPGHFVTVEWSPWPVLYHQGIKLLLLLFKLLTKASLYVGELAVAAAILIFPLVLALPTPSSSSAFLHSSRKDI